MGLTVHPMTDRRGHVDFSFDQLGLLETRHGVVTPFELVATQSVAILERRNVRGAFRIGGLAGDRLLNRRGHGTVSGSLRFS